MEKKYELPSSTQVDEMDPEQFLSGVKNSFFQCSRERDAFLHYATRFYAKTLKQSNTAMRLVDDLTIMSLGGMFDTHCRVLTSIFGKEEYYAQEEGIDFYLRSLLNINTVIEVGIRYDINLVPDLYPKMMTRLFRYAELLPPEYSSPATLALSDAILHHVVHMDVDHLEMREQERAIWDRIVAQYAQGHVGERSWEANNHLLTVEK